MTPIQKHILKQALLDVDEGRIVIWDGNENVRLTTDNTIIDESDLRELCFNGYLNHDSKESYVITEKGRRFLK